MNNMKSNKSKFALVLSILLVGILGVFAGFMYFKAQNTVPIAMALDDGYTYPTIVAMESMLENKNKTTYYDYYIMHPGDFSEEYKAKIASLEKKYGGCKITFINMEDKYNWAYDEGAITTPAYYRLSLSELLPNLDKIIWLDGDTLTFSDLKEMYSIDMKGYYYKGFLDFPMSDEFASLSDHYICSGVMLINLSELRKDDVVSKMTKFIKENGSRLSKHDQTTINAVCHEKNGVLPAKFGIFNFKNVDLAMEYTDTLIFKDKYTKEEMKEAFYNPGVLHVTAKPWADYKNPFAEKWWEYAEKTDFYSEIKAKYPIF